MPIFAAVDIGSNSVRLSIAELDRGRLIPLHQDREVTRLGEGVFRDGSLNPPRPVFGCIFADTLIVFFEPGSEVFGDAGVMLSRIGLAYENVDVEKSLH